MRTREELQWVTGFIEADGCFSTARLLTRSGEHKVRRYPCVAAGQRDPEVLYRLQKYLGLGLVHERHTINHYNYRANGFEKTQAIIAMLWDFMGPVKKEQARRVLKESEFVYE